MNTTQPIRSGFRLLTRPETDKIVSNISRVVNSMRREREAAADKTVAVKQWQYVDTYVRRSVEGE